MVLLSGPRGRSVFHHPSGFQSGSYFVPWGTFGKVWRHFLSRLGCRRARTCVCVCVCVCVCDVLPAFSEWQQRKWQSTLVFLPGKSHGQRSLVGYSPWGLEKPDKTERLTLSQAEYLAALPPFSQSRYYPAPNISRVAVNKPMDKASFLA